MKYYEVRYEFYESSRESLYYDILFGQTKILPNCTSVIQPLDQGQARRFKSINI